MLAISIEDINILMRKLLIGDDFNEFYICKATVSTYVNWDFDGSLNMDFYDDSEKEKVGTRKYAYWIEIKDQIKGFIKGNRVPLSMKLIFKLSDRQLNSLLNKEGFGRLTEARDLLITLRFTPGELQLLSGVNMKEFTLDKEVEHIWDAYVESFVKGLEA